MAVKAADCKKPIQTFKRPLPSRCEQLESLKTEAFDVVVIGGGATGAGCALDATTRGLKTALIESDDFACGTSSRSTKLIHGGVRYLQAALMRFDFEQFHMVKEALYERAVVLNQVPYVAQPVPILLPVYKWYLLPYYYAGIKMYDVVSGTKRIMPSYILTKKKALELFPMLRGEKLVGGIVYYDGQHNDARTNLVIALTAACQGATVLNHCTVTAIIKENKNGKEVITGVTVKEEFSGECWNVPAKCVINATGPFTDSIRKMDDPNVKDICTPSSGTHIVLPGYYSPERMGLLDPKTKDGRVIFFLPWLGHTIAGTTDLPCEPTHDPKPTEAEVLFILDEINNYLNPYVNAKRSEVLAAWSGIRPLVSDPRKPNTQSLARNHIVHVSDSGLVTIAGGKWTTYRSMASDTIDEAIKACKLKPRHKKCQTAHLKLIGTPQWNPLMFIRLVQDCGFEREVAEHLSNSYGDRAFEVAKLASPTGKRWPIIGKRLHPLFPYIDADIRYGVQEYAMTAVDMIARRLRFAFLNVEAAEEALPEIVNIMAEELKWSTDEKKQQMDSAKLFLQTEMGQIVENAKNVENVASRDNMTVNLSNEEIRFYTDQFESIDKHGKGYVSTDDIKKNLKKQVGVKVSEEKLQELFKEIDTNMNGQVELDEYLQIMSAIKSGHMTYLIFVRLKQIKHGKKLLKKIPVERSGGGL